MKIVQRRFHDAEGFYDIKLIALHIILICLLLFYSFTYLVSSCAISGTIIKNPTMQSREFSDHALTAIRTANKKVVPLKFMDLFTEVFLSFIVSERDCSS